MFGIDKLKGRSIVECLTIEGYTYDHGNFLQGPSSGVLYRWIDSINEIGLANRPNDCSDINFGLNYTCKIIWNGITHNIGKTKQHVI